jgi:uncharacterized protein (TIGR02646 family)
MLKVNKGAEPAFFEKVRKNPAVKRWEDLEPETRYQLKQHIVEHEQLYNGASLCPYCERKIAPEKGHIEHIKPRHAFQKLTFAYHNLLISCDTPYTCGCYKKNRWQDTFINPVEEDPEPFFHYAADGKIWEDQERVRDTVSMLNLNHRSLVDMRRTLFLQLRQYPQEFIASIDQYFNEFPSFIRYYQQYYHHNEE